MAADLNDILFNEQGAALKSLKRRHIKATLQTTPIQKMTLMCPPSERKLDLLLNQQKQFNAKVEEDTKRSERSTQKKVGVHSALMTACCQTSSATMSSNTTMKALFKTSWQ